MNSIGITLIVPTFNMSSHLEELWKSLQDTRVLEVVDEVVFVDDGSTDSTREVLGRLGPQKIRVHALAANRGRFWARYEGARVARTGKIMFLDSRCRAASGFSEALAELVPQYTGLMGTVLIDVTRSVFGLYWQRSHEFVFKRHFEAIKNVFELTPANFDRYLKGTTFLVCGREAFVRACEKFASTPLLNDDTFIIRELVNESPITFHPRLRIEWLPREDAWSFLARLWERGPSFVEYNLFRQRGGLFWATILGLAGLACFTAVLAIDIHLAFAILAAVAVLVVLSAALMSKTPVEFVRLAPLHFAVVMTFGTAILRGIVVNVWRMIRGRFPGA